MSTSSESSNSGNLAKVVPEKKQQLNFFRPNPAHDYSYYVKCLFGGVLACGTTHAMMTPVDSTKCNVQVCI